jgi:CRP/FNR family cyclic AMP-dependent transcriptional regulator
MFCNLTPEALRDYDGIGIMMSHARGAKLFNEGDAARNVFVICYGQVKISSTSRDGKTMILKIAGPGDVMGLSAVLANVPHEVTAEAIEPCQVKTVRKQEFVDFLGRHGIASMHAAQSLSGEYLTVFHDAKRLALSGSAAGRLARLLLDWGKSSANGKPEIVHHGADARGDRQHGRHLARDRHAAAEPVSPRPVDHHQGRQPDDREAGSTGTADGVSNR